MTEKHGDFVWYELMTTDVDAAEAFYGPLIGWTYEAGGPAGIDYRAFSAGDTQIGGVLGLTDEMTAGGARPAWVGYVRVDDVPKALTAIRDRGGSVTMEGGEVPGVGPFAMVADPQGAMFYVIDDRSGQPGGAFAKYAPQVGHCAWNELATSDPERAKAFYGQLFGWVKDGEMDMGPMGTYEFLRHGDYGIGAVMPKMPQMPVSSWSFYFRVPDIDAAARAIPANGGTIIQEPIEIPGGEFSLMAIDPQGAAFGLVGARKEAT
ncbi:27 kDa antigen Cfp30B [Tsuneonella dongtanensis]|uniref:27 kDa antigen Cfp30B n=1 Tax=Tsuneonella dongtanensis TaxID=692370 RepID=A0A1B2ACU0_9SPHN|nr:VOC family protein [Tsuneonella dongtanensis]ANY19969.1 27 kDa antigen Cfp30B [Tsuneonella dongtanensis]